MDDAAETADPVVPTHPGPPNDLARNITISVLVAFVVAANLGNFWFPSLITDHPLTLIAMNPSNRNLALASGDLDPWSFFLIGFLRLIGPDAFFFLLGRWYGDAAIRWMERTAPSYGELLRGLEGWFSKAQFVVVAIAPNNPVCLFAGAAGMTVGSFVTANIVGTIGRLVLIRAFSNVFEDLLSPIKDFIGEYRWPLTIVSMALVLFTIWNDRRGGREGIGDLVHLEEGIEEAEEELEHEHEADIAHDVVAPDAGAPEAPISGSAAPPADDE